MLHARDTTLTFLVMYMYLCFPEAEMYADHNSYTVLDNLKIFGRDI